MAVQEAPAWCPVEERRVVARRENPSGALDVILLILTVGLWLPVLILRSRDDARKPFRCAYCGTALRPRFVPGEGTYWELARPPSTEEKAAARRQAMGVAMIVGGLLLALAFTIGLLVLAFS